MFAIWWPLIAISALFIVRLALSKILDWFQNNKTSTSSYGELIKERLASGDYRVVAGIFDKRGIKTANTSWEADELDDDLKQYFKGRDRLRVEI